MQATRSLPSEPYCDFITSIVFFTMRPTVPRQVVGQGQEQANIPHSIGVSLDKSPYYYEIAEFINLIEQGKQESSVNSWENSLATMEIMDEVRKQLGVRYPADE